MIIILPDSTNLTKWKNRINPCEPEVGSPWTSKVPIASGPLVHPSYVTPDQRCYDIVDGFCSSFSSSNLCLSVNMYSKRLEEICRSSSSNDQYRAVLSPDSQVVLLLPVLKLASILMPLSSNDVSKSK